MKRRKTVVSPFVSNESAPEGILQRMYVARERWETTDFVSGMKLLLESDVSLDDPLSDKLVFHYGADCFEGGRFLARSLTTLEAKGSKFAFNLLGILQQRNDVEFSSCLLDLRNTSDSLDNLVQLLARVGLARPVMERALDALGVARDYRIVPRMSTASVAGHSVKIDFEDPKQSFVEVFEEGSWNTKKSMVKPIGEIEIKLLRDAVTFGGSSLILADGRAFLPWQDFHLSSENVLRGDSQIVAIGNEFVVVRGSPVRSYEILGPSISLTSDIANHFGHFVLDCLPRLNACKIPIENRPISATIDASATQFESLVRRVVPEITFHVIDRGKAARHETLRVAIPCRFTPSDLTWGSPFLHDECDQTTTLPSMFNSTAKRALSNDDGGIKLSLLRSGTGEESYRRLQNVVQICVYLETAGFRLISLSDIDFSNLERLVASAHTVVAEAGSSLALNLMMMDIKGKSILLVQAPALGRQEARFAGALAVRGARVALISGVSESPERQADFSVDLSLIKAGLRRLGVQTTT